MRTNLQILVLAVEATRVARRTTIVASLPAIDHTVGEARKRLRELVAHLVAKRVDFSVNVLADRVATAPEMTVDLITPDANVNLVLMTQARGEVDADAVANVAVAGMTGHSIAVRATLLGKSLCRYGLVCVRHKGRELQLTHCASDRTDQQLTDLLVLPLHLLNGDTKAN